MVLALLMGCGKPNPPSVSLQDAGGKIAAAGVQVSGLDYIAFSSVTTGNSNASSIILTGTGTAVVYSSAQANGGSVGVESVRGKGSTFFVVLTSDEGDRGMIHHAPVNK